MATAYMWTPLTVEAGRDYDGIDSRRAVPFGPLDVDGIAKECYDSPRAAFPFRCLTHGGSDD